MYNRKFYFTTLFCFCTIFILFSFINNIKIANLTTEVNAKEEDVEVDSNKIAYLTFDDGPTNITKDVLEVLKENNVTGTFFVIGQLLEENSEIAKEIVKQGHAVCVHTYTHNENIYKTNDAFMKDHKKCADLVKNLTAQGEIKYMRFPGGSSTIMATKSTLRIIRSDIVNSGLYYVDWNVSIEDAMGRNRPVSDLMSNYHKQLKGCKQNDRIIVLMHDSKYNKTTIPALKNIISELKSQGYAFRNFKDLDELEIKKLEQRSLINKYEKKSEKQVSNN